MRPYRIVQAVFIITLLTYAANVIYAGYPAFGLLVILIIYLIIVAIASFNMQLNFYVNAYSQPVTPQNSIAITFDDGPSAAYTTPILDLLKKHGAKATFFCIGKHVQQHPDIAEAIHKNGHAIGNHSYDHGYMFDFLPAGKVRNEITQTNEIISNITNKKVDLFRPPYGVTNPPIAKAVKATGMNVIGWNVRSYDTLGHSPEKVLQRVLPKIKPGAVILLHDNRHDTIKILEGILLYATRHNLNCVDVYEMFEIKSNE